MAPEEVSQASIGLPIGEKIGKYEVCEKLGTGGQAIVYKCYDATLDRFVAIKQISTHLAEDPRFLDRFRKEAQILAKLGAEQPAIVTIHELLEDPRGLFIVMEFVEGHTLERVLRENPGAIEPRAVLQILWRLAGALHVVHAAGIIHRDLKPGNIIVGEGLRAKITDFGVAASITGQTSMLLGTTKYMAPELFTGEQADGRADMYSLGFIAYEMLLGREKFNEIFYDVVRDRHSEALRWMKWHGNESVQAPPLHEVDPKVPRALSDIVVRMTAKNKDERFESMESLGRAVKTSFSPRGKTGAGARAGGRRPPLVPVAPVAELAGKTGDEGDELELEPAGSTTAPIPKPTMTRKTKLILLGVFVLTGMAISIVLLVRSAQNEKAMQAEAARRFESAMVLYREAPKKADTAQRRKSYVEALKTLKQLRQPPFDKTRPSAKAFVVIPVCEGRVAILDSKWQDAQVKHREAEDCMKELLRLPAAQPGSDLDRFAQSFTDDIKRLRDDLQNVWEVDAALQLAEEAFQKKSYDIAIRIVEGKLTTLNLSKENADKCKAFLGKVRQEQFRVVVTQDIDGGEKAADEFLTLVKAGPSPRSEQLFDLANTSFASAEKRLGSDEAQVLPDEELKVLRKRVADGKANLTSASEYHRKLVEIAEARTKNDKAKLVKLLTEADALRPSDPMKAEIVKLETDQEYTAILGLVDKGLIARAIVDLRKFAAKHPQHPNAKAMLDNLEKNRDRQILVVQGDRALKSKNWAEAKEKFGRARELQPDPDLDKKIRDCEFYLMLAQADSLYEKKQYPQAEIEFARLIQGFPEHAPVVQARLVRLQREVRYLQTLDRARKEIQTGHYADARKILKEINPPTEDSNQLVKLSFFTENREKGKSEIARGQGSSATGYLNIAKRYAQTPEQVKEVEDLLERAAKLEREQPSGTGGGTE